MSKRRTGQEFLCKHGCGYVFKKNKDANKQEQRKERDAFDYHEKQGCPLLPRLICPLKCSIKEGQLITFKGIKAFKNHLKSKRHISEALKVGISPDNLEPQILKSNKRKLDERENPNNFEEPTINLSELEKLANLNSFNPIPTTDNYHPIEFAHKLNEPNQSQNAAKKKLLGIPQKEIQIPKLEESFNLDTIRLEDIINLTTPICENLQESQFNLQNLETKSLKRKSRNESLFFGTSVKLPDFMRDDIICTSGNDFRFSSSSLSSSGTITYENILKNDLLLDLDLKLSFNF